MSRLLSVLHAWVLYFLRIISEGDFLVSYMSYRPKRRANANPAPKLLTVKYDCKNFPRCHFLCIQNMHDSLVLFAGFLFSPF
jgi:hypothetical protein